jgi:hypothetical protein
LSFYSLLRVHLCCFLGLIGRGPLGFCQHLPHLFSLLDSNSRVGVPVPTAATLRFYNGHFRSLLLCFSFSRLLWAFPIPLSWTKQFSLRMCPQ